MALNNVNTLVTLHDELEIYCNSHYQIQRFKFEFEEQLENFSTEGKEFPILYAVPQSFGKGGMTDIHTIRIYVLSRLNRDRDNTLDNVNDTSLILNDTIKYWNSSNRNSDILLTNDPVGTPVNNSQLDYLQGYYADFDFELKSYSRCDIPIPDGVPRVGASGSSYIEPFLTCSSLSDCVTFTNNIDNLQNQINNLDAEKWTFGVDLDDTYLDFTRNDGSTYSVDLQPLIDQLETDVLTNSNDITTNTNDISNLELDLSGATSSILTNTNDISTNQTNIGNNLTLINTNSNDITTNQTDIGDNLTLINTNIIDISNLELDLLNYLPLSGGQITGDLSVTGDFEVLGTTTTIGTQTIQALDNNFTLNFDGTHTSADGGGITIQDGVSNGNDSSWLINSDGNWYTNQNVGIGTSTPTHKLTTGYGTGIPEDGIALYGTTDQTTNYQRSIFYNTGGNVGVFDSQFGGTGVTGYWSFKINGGQRVEIDSQQIINYGNLFFVDDNLKTIGRANSTFRPKAVYVGTTGVQIGALSSLPKAQMLDVYGGGYFQDNVGIGTNSPESKLDISDEVNIPMSTNSDGQVRVRGAGYTLGVALDGNAAHIYHNSTSRDLIFGTNETPRLTVKGTGNVGIGTTIPQTKLDVDGEITVGIERWIIDLMSATTKVIYASESLSITLVEDIVNAPTTTILLNGSAYTLGGAIVSGDRIDIIVSTASVIKLKIEK